MNLKEKTIKDLQRYYKFKNYVIPNILNQLKVIEYELEGVGALEYSDMPGPAGGKKITYRREKLLDKKTNIELNLAEKKAFVEYIDKALEYFKDDKEIIIECLAKDKREKLKDHEICNKFKISNATLYRKKIDLLDELIENLYGV